MGWGRVASFSPRAKRLGGPSVARAVRSSRSASPDSRHPSTAKATRPSGSPTFSAITIQGRPMTTRPNRPAPRRKRTPISSRATPSSGSTTKTTTTIRTMAAMTAAGLSPAKASPRSRFGVASKMCAGVTSARFTLYLRRRSGSGRSSHRRRTRHRAPSGPVTIDPRSMSPKIYADGTKTGCIDRFWAHQPRIARPWRNLSSLSAVCGCPTGPPKRCAASTSR